MWDEISE